MNNNGYLGQQNGLLLEIMEGGSLMECNILIIHERTNLIPLVQMAGTAPARF